METIILGLVALLVQFVLIHFNFFPLKKFALVSSIVLFTTYRQLIYIFDNNINTIKNLGMNIWIFEVYQ